MNMKMSKIDFSIHIISPHSFTIAKRLTSCHQVQQQLEINKKVFYNASPYFSKHVTKHRLYHLPKQHKQAAVICVAAQGEVNPACDQNLNDFAPSCPLRTSSSVTDPA